MLVETEKGIICLERIYLCELIFYCWIKILIVRLVTPVHSDGLVRPMVVLIQLLDKTVKVDHAFIVFRFVRNDIFHEESNL